MEKIRGARYEIVVDEKITLPKWDPGERRLYVNRPLLEADVKISLLGERIAGLLLPPVEASSNDLEELIAVYRRRVAAEQAIDLVSRLGPLAKMASIDLAYFPVSRAQLVWGDVGCMLDLDPERLRKAFREAARVAGEVAGDTVRVMPRRYREFIYTTLRRLQISTINWASSIMRLIRASGYNPLSLCRERDEEPPDPSWLVYLPEGQFLYDCPGVEDIAENYVGGDARCKKVGFTSSTLVCEGPSGKIAVKEYLRMIAKWLPASILSRSAVKYLITPKSRLYNEYKHLIELRSIIQTPRILAVCGDPVKAVMARSFIEGTPVIDSGDPGEWRDSGRALADIHNAGYVLGDPNPGNFVASRDGLGLIDAEQARRFTPAGGAWDLIVYVYYPVALGKDRDLIVEGVKGYLERVDPRRKKRVVRELRKGKIWLGLVLLPYQFRKAREVFREAGVELT